MYLCGLNAGFLLLMNFSSFLSFGDKKQIAVLKMKFVKSERDSNDDDCKNTQLQPYEVHPGLNTIKCFLFYLNYQSSLQHSKIYFSYH